MMGRRLLWALQLMEAAVAQMPLLHSRVGNGFRCQYAPVVTRSLQQRLMHRPQNFYRKQLLQRPQQLLTLLQTLQQRLLRRLLSPR